MKQHGGSKILCYLPVAWRIKPDSFHWPCLSQSTSGLHLEPCLSFWKLFSLTKRVLRYTLCLAGFVLCLLIVLLSRRPSLLLPAQQSLCSTQVLCTSPESGDCLRSALRHVWAFTGPLRGPCLSVWTNELIGWHVAGPRLSLTCQHCAEHVGAPQTFEALFFQRRSEGGGGC